MRRALVVSTVVALALASSCGKKGPPRPPEPRGPLPPLEVEARQLGSEIWVAFVMPMPRGPEPAQQPDRVELVRVAYPPGLDPPADPDAFRRRGEVIATEAATVEPGGRVRIVDRPIGDLALGGVGSTLRYGVRVRDRRGRSSPLVVAPDLVPIAPPPPPRGLRGEATADGVRLVWDSPQADGRFRYNVYRAPAGEPFGDRPLNRDPLTTPEYLDLEVNPGGSHAYVVRTAASDGPPFLESVDAGPVEVLAQDLFPPGAPTGLVAVQEGGAVRLFWNPNPERDLSGYRIYRRSNTGPWRQFGPEIVIQPLYLDTEVEPGEHAAYKVTAVDRAANESAPSEIVEMDMTGDEETPGPWRQH